MRPDSMQEVQVWHDVDRETFQSEIVALDRPAVLKSLVREWPVVKAARRSPAALTAYLGQYDAGEKIAVCVGPPAIKGRFFYRDDLRGFNFDRVERTLLSTLKALTATELHEPPGIAMQAFSIADNLPGFRDDNDLSLLDESVLPRMWLGNKTITVTHYDTSQNIACAVAGRRRITFFPPEQIANLYPGPLLLTPGGAHVSMVDPREPDLSRYPKFEHALASASQAEIEPGDAVYIPSLWWHNVESLDNLSMQVNYWWGRSEETDVTPYQSLLHSLLTIPDLPVEKRKVWRAFFDYFVFQVEQDPAAHLPADLNDIIGTLSAERKSRIMKRLGDRLCSDDTQHLKQ
jgi:hypothetical protein